eukprot:TRINITY_DN24787_c0_g1_i1.p1 TRINITY_DN24787_c0_g1~~TRINITY_DN24787_c0_g1_i1.p1  ORF type:complete len:316 (+),score=42.86 TRINITY_DN24787_c0_g1_i1:75-1022(+)
MIYWLTSLCVVVAIASIGLKTLQLFLYKGTTEFQVRHHDLNIDGQRVLRIGHISDFHYDKVKGTLPDVVLHKALEELKTSQLDIICATGDYINDDPAPSKELAEKYLSSLKYASSHGVYASLGNHDYKDVNGRKVISKNLSDAGVNVLLNEGATAGRGVKVIGLEDQVSPGWKTARNALRNELQDYSGFEKILILTHNPDTAPRIVGWLQELEHEKGLSLPRTLLLSGHTHGGQICNSNGIPYLSYIHEFFSALNFTYTSLRWTPFRLAFTVKNWRFAEGLHQLAPNITLIVSRGLGSHSNARMNCPADIGIIEF